MQMKEEKKPVEERRQALRIIGAIGTTCAFPFSADELYGQHEHSTSSLKSAQLPKPSFFTEKELAQVSRVADLIIPETDTPGAIGAGVPAYIDMVCSRNAELAETVRKGLQGMPETITEGVLMRLQDEQSPFFRAMKNLTADGYYTSKIGLIEELGYKGNTVLAEFPSCTLPEH